MTYTDKDGKLLNPVMGCYGIGVGRLLACIVENSHDDKGPIWPKSVAPWPVEICALNLNQDEVKNVSCELYSKLSKNTTCCLTIEISQQERNLPTLTF